MSCELFRKNEIKTLKEEDLKIENGVISPLNNEGICIILFTNTNENSSLLKYFYSELDKNIVGIKFYECTTENESISNLVKIPSIILYNDITNENIKFKGVVSLYNLCSWILLNLKSYVKNKTN